MYVVIRGTEEQKEIDGHVQPCAVCAAWSNLDKLLAELSPGLARPLVEVQI